jgi:Ala-tRNA(Pro) deacylase
VPELPATSLRVLALLQSSGCSFSTLEHGATRTCEESAAVRGADVASGAKAMLLKCSKPLPHGSPFLLAVLSAARKADLRALRGALGQKSVSLASVEEVHRLSGCIPGAVPPFGSLFPGVATYCDPSLLDRAFCNFNCGLQTLSVLNLSLEDYVRVEKPTRLAFSTA